MTQPAPRLVLFDMDDVLCADSRPARAAPEQKHAPGSRQGRGR